LTHLRIAGGNRLSGEIESCGSKNAALPVIAAALLVPGKVTLRHIPDLTDVHVICQVLESLGAVTAYDKQNHSLTIDASGVSSVEPPYDLVEKMRASFLVLGPLLARFGEARVPLPGGCRIGTRSVDSHLHALKDFGPEIFQERGVIVARGKLKAAEVYLEMPSVTATENVLSAAALVEGNTIVYNCAQEPEIVDLAEFLNACGANIEGAGTPTVTVEGVTTLHGCDYSIIPDRIVTGTYLLAGAATGGCVKITNARPDHLTALLDKLVEIGCTVAMTKDSIMVDAPEEFEPASVRTLVYPGFPTDLQPQMMTTLTLSNGLSLVTETLYENRFTHVPELNRMGANITIRGNTAIIEPTEDGLIGVPVRAYDIRGGAAMVIAGLAARGETTISGVGFIDRGHENFEDNLRSLGAVIAREDGEIEEEEEANGNG
jgi:UDP-N-acetylglucosamine 1-carboxyvinyltransferase